MKQRELRQNCRMQRLSKNWLCVTVYASVTHSYTNRPAPPKHTKQFPSRGDNHSQWPLERLKPRFTLFTAHTILHHLIHTQQKCRHKEQGKGMWQIRTFSKRCYEWLVYASISHTHPTLRSFPTYSTVSLPSIASVTVHSTDNQSPYLCCIHDFVSHAFTQIHNTYTRRAKKGEKAKEWGES